MIRRLGNNAVINKRVALALLIYTCLFVFDDTPFTSVWDNLPQAEVGRLICGEEQEESLAMVTLIKTRLRTTLSARPSFSAEFHQSMITSLTRANSSLLLRSQLAVLSLQRKRSIDYCIFQI